MLLPSPIWIPAYGSSYLRKFRWWPADEYGLSEDVLDVVFKDGFQAHYFGIGYSQFYALVRAPSQGKAFWSLVRVRGTKHAHVARYVPGPFVYKGAEVMS